MFVLIKFHLTTSCYITSEDPDFHLQTRFNSLKPLSKVASCHRNADLMYDSRWGVSPGSAASHAVDHPVSIDSHPTFSHITMTAGALVNSKVMHPGSHYHNILSSTHSLARHTCAVNVSSQTLPDNNSSE